jgi:hypothetical protein
MQLLISSPWWFIVLCLLAGFGYAYLLYKPHFKDLPHKIMAMLRFLSISLLCFFLLAPVLIQSISSVEKPKVLMVLDNSQSIIAGGDSAFYKTGFLTQWYKAREILGGDYEVQFLNVGNNINISDSSSFTQKKTNIGQLFDYVNNTYDRQNIGAVVLASDGIYNRGSNPAYKELNHHALLYTVGMGDTTLKKDGMIKDVNANAIAYLNNEFPVEINLAAYACGGTLATLTLSSEGKVMHSEQVNIGTNDFFKNVLVNVQADQPGTKHIVISLSAIPGEASAINNRKDVFIDVIDGREKILLAYNGPHPDIGAIKEAIQSNQNYEVIAMPVTQVKLADLVKYNVAILHQLPARGYNTKDLITQLRNNKIPIWCIVGNQTAIDQLPLVSSIGRIDRNQGRYNESQPVWNEAFNTFTIDEATKRTITALPPLQVPYGVFAASDNAEIMTFQKIGAVTTKAPVWAFSNQNGEKTAILFGEGFWRWRLVDFAENESHAATNEMVSKTIQYLAVKEDKRKFRVYPTKNVYEEDEPIRFIAELYNASYELVNDADVKLVLTNSEDKNYNYTFSKSGKSYQLDIGIMPPGPYKFTAQAEGIPDKIRGKILITPLQTELVNTRADFGLLRGLAKKHNGRFYEARQLAGAIDAIKQNKAITSVSFNEKRLDELINVKWIFFLLAALIAAEWFIRKYEGGY